MKWSFEVLAAASAKAGSPIVSIHPTGPDLASQGCHLICVRQAEPIASALHIPKAALWRHEAVRQGTRVGQFPPSSRRRAITCA